jgi:DNA primase
VPYDSGIIQYETRAGIVKHFYGVKFALGGIFSIKGGDFERTNGFPNFWTWGGEDNYMQYRVLQSGLKIDRRGFFPLQHPNILQMVEGIMRTISRSEAEMVFYKTTNDGLYTIQNLNYNEEEKLNTNAVDFRYIHVSHFDCAYSHASNTYEEQNIHEEKRIKFKSRGIASAAQEEQQRAMYQQQVLAEQEQRLKRLHLQKQQQQQRLEHQQRLQQQQHQQRLQQQQPQQQQQQHQQRLQQQQPQQQPQQTQQQQPQPQPQQRLQQRVVRRVRKGFF